MKLKILITLGKDYCSDARKIIARYGKLNIFDSVQLSQKSLAQIIHRYDGVIIGLNHRFNKTILSNARHLKFIATVTTGLDHIDLREAQSRKVAILSLKGEKTFLSKITGTAELAFGLMINLARNIPSAIESVKHFQWNRRKFLGHNLFGKVLGIIGMGRLGTWMARYGRAFGMEVFFYDPYVKKSAVSRCQKISFLQLLKKSDFISLHVPLNRETNGMINIVAFDSMKKSAYLVNTSRGQIVCEKDLLKALKQGIIAGYAADVIEGEPFLNKRCLGHPLVIYARRNTNVLLVPHLGGMTFESRQATDIFMAQKVEKYIERNLVKL